MFARLVVAVAAGAAGVLAFAPFYAWPLAIVSLVVLFSLWAHTPAPRQAAAIGFAWGLGLFLAGVSWIYVSLHVYGNMPAPLAGLAVFLFCSYLALYPALAGWLQARLQVPSLMRLLLLMPVAFVSAEYLRGWVVSGFPWLILGYSQTPSAEIMAPLAGYAPVLGVFGISLILALTAGAVVAASKNLSTLVLLPAARHALVIAAVVLWLGGVLLAAQEWSSPSGKALPVSLVQGNIAQHLKWREDQRAATIEAYLELAEQSRGRLIVLPETALPMMLHDVPGAVLSVLHRKAAANGGDLLMGIAYADGNTKAANFIDYYNGAVSIGASPPQRYAKQHLVAFGEFVPPLFSWVYRWLTIPLSGFTPGPRSPAPMQLAGHFVGVNICYEDTFGAEIAASLPRAELLVNMSNMAWYGDSLAADQHAQFSQMRALETSRWMLRSTNTGVTAAMDEKGRIVKALPQFTRGVLEVEAVPRQGVTPYVRWKDAPVLLLLVLVLLLSFNQHRRAVK